MLTLEQVKPIPLTEQSISQGSQIWKTTVHFKKGKKYLLLAPSGKGKSTLIHLIYGLRKDYEGEILFNDKKTRNFTSEEWADCRQKHFSIVFQDLRLFPQLTALENILIKTELKKHKTIDEIKEMSKKLGIEVLLNQHCGTLSYGQQQRVALIRALCQPFDFLLLDEPFSHLDEANIKAATDLISQECKAQDASLLLVSLGDRYFFNYNKELLL